MDEKTLLQLVNDFLKHLGITVDEITPETVAAHQLLNVQTSDSKLLIGPHGDNLRALNYLLRRMVEKKTGDREHRFLVDVNGYQLARIRDLEQKATLLADRVRTFKSSAEMTPMNAYERMIIHSLFSEDPDVTTSSAGEGKARHVILKYRGEEAGLS